jgi:hypothetical protein
MLYGTYCTAHHILEGKATFRPHKKTLKNRFYGESSQLPETRKNDPLPFTMNEKSTVGIAEFTYLVQRLGKWN